MQASIDNFGVERVGLVNVKDEYGVVDATGCVNDAQYVNNFCGPNAELREVRIGNLPFVFKVALKDIRAGQDVLIDYKLFR